MFKQIVYQIHFRTNKVLQYFEKGFWATSFLKRIIFFSGILFYLYYIGVFNYLHYRPCSIHLSAQTQRASIALNYYEGDMNFFMPQIQRQTQENGITGVEFPIIYYAAAVCYKLFGFNDMYLRVISLLLVLYGFYCFYLLIQQYIGNYLLSFLLFLSAALSPVLVFYTPNFMPDAPSMAMQLAGWYYLFQHIKSNKLKTLNLFLFFSTLGALIKATSAIIFFVTLVLLFLDRFNFFKQTGGGQKLFKKPLRVFVYVLTGLAITAVWYIYARWLTSAYGNESFALKPLMIESWKAFEEITEVIKNMWARHFFAYETYVLMISAIIAVVVLIKFCNRLLLTVTLLLLAGYCVYVYLFLYQFKWHDYYIIAMMPALFFLILTFGELIKRLADRYFKPAMIIFILALFFNIKEALIHCKKNYDERYSRDMYYWTGDNRVYEDLEPKLRSMGIKRTDRFISGFDDSYCGSLYLMNQLGVTLYKNADSAEIAKQISNPTMKYMVLNDSAKFNKIYPNQFNKLVIGHHRGLIIYKIR